LSTSQRERERESARARAREREREREKLTFLNFRTAKLHTFEPVSDGERERAR
jgi:hypothetical protein